MHQFAKEFDSLDAIITNAGGCGSHLKHYGSLLESGPARNWDEKVKDIHEFLSEQGFEKPNGESSPTDAVLTYHESCHLCHGQRIKSAPREILRALPGWKIVELPNSDACCGSAGIYNILQPEESSRVLDRKLKSIVSTGAQCVVTSNPGCHLQIQNGLAAAGSSVQVDQPVSLLAKAYRESRH